MEAITKSSTVRSPRCAGTLSLCVVKTFPQPRSSVKSKETENPCTETLHICARSRLNSGAILPVLPRNRSQVPSWGDCWWPAAGTQLWCLERDWLFPRMFSLSLSNLLSFSLPLLCLQLVYGFRMQACYALEQEGLVCLLPFGKKQSSITLTGITNNESDLSVDLFRTVTLRLMRFFMPDAEELSIKVCVHCSTPSPSPLHCESFVVFPSPLHFFSALLTDTEEGSATLGWGRDPFCLSSRATAPVSPAG